MKIHVRTLLIRLGAVFGAAPLLVLAFAIASDGSWEWLWLPAPGLAAIALALVVRTTRAAAAASAVLGACAIVGAWTGGFLLIPSVLLFLAAALARDPSRPSARAKPSPPSSDGAG